MATERKAMTVYVPANLHARIEAAAKADGRSVSNFVQRILDATVPRVLGDRVVIPTGLTGDVE
jgi:predicted HicB family RNase H-like nuclease